MARIEAGDDTPLGTLYDRYGGFVYGLAHRVCRDPKGAEDLTQDVFVSLWESPGAFDSARGSLRAFLGTVTHRRAVDWVRKEVAGRRREDREAAEVGAAETVDVAATATDNVLAQRVRHALAALPDEQREVIVLAYFGAMSYRDVAASVSLPEGTVKSRIRLGMAKLASLMEAEGLDAWT